MIYCVEDELNIRELLIYTLETTGFSSRGFSSGKELRAALREELPDLILLDITFWNAGICWKSKSGSAPLFQAGRG